MRLGDTETWRCYFPTPYSSHPLPCNINAFLKYNKRDCEFFNKTSEFIVFTFTLFYFASLIPPP